ncbi:MAG: hypothetical protein HC888_06420 [Candidatus Competibacteraceae bacterium]|nr:hypothetical protein [Candidatus Competibacteraceae bacterium]
MNGDFVDEDLRLIPVGTTVENHEGLQALVEQRGTDCVWLRLLVSNRPVMEACPSTGWRRVTRDEPLAHPAVLAGRKVVAAFEGARFTILRDGDRVTLAMVDAQAFIEAVAELDRMVGR